MWTPATRRQHSRIVTRYQTDLTDAEWRVIAPHLPKPCATGRPREWPMREILNGIFYVVRARCQQRQEIQYRAEAFLVRRRWTLTAEAERPFSETWAMLGATVELAGRIVEADPAELIALLTTARKGIGTEGERSLLSVMVAMRQGAAAQLELADAAILMIETVTNYADETALAALSAGQAH